MLLGEKDLPLGAVNGTPLLNPALQRAQYPFTVLAGVSALQFVQQRYGIELWIHPQQRYDLTVPRCRAGIGPYSPTPG